MVSQVDEEEMMSRPIGTVPEPIAKWMTFCELPENSDRHFELIYGELIEKLPGTTYNSWLALKIGIAAHHFGETAGIPGQFATALAPYAVGSHIVLPKLSYKRTPMVDTYPDFGAPLWVVEVIAPTDAAVYVRDKRQIYLNAGILYWEVYPNLQRVDVYAPGEPMRSVDANGTLDGGAVLPGFTLAAAEVWKD